MGDSPWSNQVQRVLIVKGSGPGSGLFIYDASGNLLYNVTGATKDPFGNTVKPQATSYANDGFGSFIQMIAGLLVFGNTTFPTQASGAGSVNLQPDGSLLISVGGTGGNLQLFQDGTAKLNKVKVLSDMAATTLSNSAAETVVCQFTIPSVDSIQAQGMGYQFRAWGEASTTGTPTLTFRLRIGGTGTTADDLATPQPFVLGTALNIANAPWAADGYFYVKSTGTAQALASWGIRELVRGGSSNVWGNSGFTAGGLTLTSPVFVSITAQWSAASPSNIVAPFIGSLERIGAQ